MAGIFRIFCTKDELNWSMESYKRLMPDEQFNTVCTQKGDSRYSLPGYFVYIDSPDPIEAFVKGARLIIDEVKSNESN